MTRPVLAACLLPLCLLGCAPALTVREDALRAAAPRTLAVLPIGLEHQEPGERAALQVGGLERVLRRRAGSLPWLVLEQAEVARRLARAGSPPAQELRAAPPGRWAGLLGVDAVVLGRVTRLYNLETGVLYRQALGAELRLVDARTGEELARVEHAVSDTGGLLLDYSQSFEAVQNTLDNSSDLGFLRLAEALAEKLLAAFPAPPTRPEVTPPAVELVALCPSREGALGAGDALEVELVSGPGLTAALDLGSERAEVPLVEELPGRYRGVYRVQLGDRFDGAARVHVHDAFGVGAARVVEEPRVRIEARPPGAPQRLVAVEDGRGLLLRWDSAPGPAPARWRVVGVGDDGVAATLAETEAREARLAAAAGRVAVVGIDAQGNLGALAWLDTAREEESK